MGSGDDRYSTVGMGLDWTLIPGPVSALIDSPRRSRSSPRHRGRRAQEPALAKAEGFPEAIGTVFPVTTVQTCIIHLIRNSLAFVLWKDRKLIMPDLKAIYRAETAQAAQVQLDAFEDERAGAIRRSARLGGAAGSMWCRSSLSRRRSAR